MKKMVVFSVMMLMLLSIAGEAGAATYWLPGVSEATGWYDVEKTGGDSLMCWAASASNNLAYAHWWGWDTPGNQYLDTSQEIFNTFKSHWTNAVGAPFYGYEWWLTNRATSIVNAAKALDGGGLNFYPGVPVDFPPTTVTFYSADVNQFLPFYIQNGRATSLFLNDLPCPPGGCVGTYDHAITLWGYDDTNHWLWVTDSDDGVNQLTKYSYSVSAGNVWSILGYTNSYTTPTNVVIDEVTRLNYNADLLEPNGKPSGNGNGNGSIPEPSTMLLLGSGILALGVLSTKRRIR